MLTLDDVCAKALALPCSPALLPRLINLLEQPHADIEDMAKLIQLDPVLASATMRMANSVYFGGEIVSETVAQAVMRLGARELYRLAALSMAARWMSIEVEGYRWEAGDFCRASLIKAVAAEALAQRTGAVDSAQAYTCGLVYELGKLALAFSCSASFAVIRERCSTDGCTWMEAETAVLGFNHAAVSARLLAEWRFSEACVVVAANNPPSQAIAPAHRALAAHIHAANHMAAAFGAGQGEDAFLFKLDDDLLSEHGITAEMIEQTLPTVFERSTRLLSTRLSTGKLEF